MQQASSTTAKLSSNEEKHRSRNPMQRLVIGNFHRQVVDAVKRLEPQAVLDVGCGEGFTLSALVEGKVAAKLHGIELSSQAVERARTRLGPAAEIVCGDATSLSGEALYDVVMMLEVLEHLEDPRAMLPILERLTRRYVLLSVPWEPFFRGANLLRGRHLSRWGNHPEHINLWSRGSFLDFVSQRFDIVSVPFAFPWTLVLAQRRVQSGDRR